MSAAEAGGVMEDDDPIEQAMRELETLGLIARWWCERCQDRVPYRTHEMTEAQSRRLHNGRHATETEATDG